MRHQTAADVAVLNADDPRVAAFADGLASQMRWFSQRRPVERGAFVRNGQIVLAAERPHPVIDLAALAVPDAHMVENAVAACAAAACAGVVPAVMTRVLRAFRGQPYRFRLVAERSGVAFYEDSMAMNPTSAAAAIRSLRRPFHLIAGSLRKGARPEDFAPMTEAMDVVEHSSLTRSYGLR